MEIFIASANGIDLAAFTARDQQEAKQLLEGKLRADLQKLKSMGSPLLAAGDGLTMRQAELGEADAVADWMDDIAESATKGEHVVFILWPTDREARH